MGAGGAGLAMACCTVTGGGVTVWIIISGGGTVTMVGTIILGAGTTSFATSAFRGVICTDSSCITLGRATCTAVSAAATIATWMAMVMPMLISLPGSSAGLQQRRTAWALSKAWSG